jgi:hypothetical protein
MISWRAIQSVLDRYRDSAAVLERRAVQRLGRFAEHPDLIVKLALTLEMESRVVSRGSYRLLQLPAPFMSHVHIAQPVILQLPGPLQATVQPPPEQARFNEPAPLLVAVQPPIGQLKLHEPLPLQVKAQLVPSQVRVHELLSVHAEHAVPLAQLSSLAEPPQAAANAKTMATTRA